MPLLQLPPELLIDIMDHVGSSYFREDLKRLTICKHWFEFARPAYFKDVDLSQKTLLRLMASQDVEKSLSLIKDNMKTLDLYMNGFRHWDYIPEAQYNSQLDDALDALNAQALDLDSYERLRNEVWKSGLDSDLSQFSAVTKESQKLRTIRIEATYHREPRTPQTPHWDYLSLSPVRALLSVEHLTVLELDLCGTSLIQSGYDIHICTTIAALLATLKRLRLRMRSICADVLRPLRNDIVLCLDEVLINLSLTERVPTKYTLTGQSKRCGSASETAKSYTGLRADIEKQAKALAARMDCPKHVRILDTYYMYRSNGTRSLDVISGNCMLLKGSMAWENDMAWKANGEIIDDISV